MNTIRLIAFDLDGTFLDSCKNIPEENIRAIECAAQMGIHIVPATGRLYTGLPAVLRELPCIRYYILINGALVYDAAEDKVLLSAELSNDLALSIFSHGDAVHALYDCYLNNQGLMTRSMYDALDAFVPDKHYLSYMRSIRQPVDDLSALVRTDGGTVQKVQYFFTDMEERARQLELLPKLFPGVKATSSMPMNIEINSAKASKGPALSFLCSYLGFSDENALAFGDGTNDLDMLLAAGTGVAMKNSDEKLFSAADLITEEDNNAAGVGKTILKLLEHA